VVHIAARGDGQADATVRKLASLGIVPGSRIRLIQKRPLPVIALGNSRFAIDMNAADLVMCVPDAGGGRECGEGPP
jgi:Fe2+ transport system protein FeoA